MLGRTSGRLARIEFLSLRSGRSVLPAKALKQQQTMAASSAAKVLEPFRLERYFAKYEFTAEHQLCNSDCESLTMKQLLPMMSDESRRLWDNMSFAYTETQGLPQLRHAVAKSYASDLITADNIQVLAPEEGIYITMRCLLRAGDDVVATWPCYQSLTEVAKSSGASIHHWEVTETAEGFHFDVDRLENIIREKQPKLVVVNFPHNPTGALPTHAQWERIIELTRRCGAYLFSDEMYRLLEYDETNRLSSACERYDKAVCLAGMSKALSLPGLRIGWLATQDMALLQDVATYRDYVTICASAPAEILALAGMHASESIVGENRKRIAAGIAAVKSFVQGSEGSAFFEWRQPKAGPIALLALKGDASADEYCRQLVEKHGLLLLPSSLFGWGDKHMRIGFGRDSAVDVVKVWRKSLEEGTQPEAAK